MTTQNPYQDVMNKPISELADRMASQEQQFTAIVDRDNDVYKGTHQMPQERKLSPETVDAIRQWSQEIDDDFSGPGTHTSGEYRGPNLPFGK